MRQKVIEENREMLNENLRRQIVNMPRIRSMALSKKVDAFLAL